MERIIGILAPFMKPHHRDQIAAAAAENGFVLREYQTADEMVHNAADCEILYGYLGPDIIRNDPALRWFQSASAGVEQYCDPTLWHNPDALLTNSSGAYGITISEHMLCVTLMLLRRMKEYAEVERRHEWVNLGEVRSIYGSNVAVIGTGDLGTNFARRVKALGAARVVGVKRTPKSPDPCYDKIYTTADIAEAVRDADIVAVCLPHTKETAGLVSAQVIASMPPRAIVVNVGRGRFIDQDALIDALNSGRIAGAALDVMTPEPLPADHPLWSAKNVLITPHVSGNMSLGLTCDIDVALFCDNIGRYRRGEPLRCLVDRTRGY